jgi:hypothetical protein
MRGSSFQIVTFIGPTASRKERPICAIRTLDKGEAYSWEINPSSRQRMLTSGLRPQGLSCNKMIVIFKVLGAKTNWLARNRQSWSNSDSDSDSDSRSRLDLIASSTVLARAGSNLTDRPKLASCETVVNWQHREHGSRGVLIVGAVTMQRPVKT